jgi:hypothetical protein
MDTCSPDVRLTHSLPGHDSKEPGRNEVPDPPDDAHRATALVRYILTRSQEHIRRGEFGRQLTCFADEEQRSVCRSRPFGEPLSRAEANQLLGRRIRIDYGNADVCVLGSVQRGLVQWQAAA